jgi:hypothetical protein
MLSPHLASHHAGHVAAVAYGDPRGAIHEIWDLLSVMLTGRREVYSTVDLAD